uniref:SCO2400 family protein n=1 Tax=Streptomyces caniscabiei TaxID=2746961 RepID=UPI003B97FC34
MDYCHPCRRHLNGALACPGCGTPVEELRAYADDADAHADEAEETSPEPADEPGPRASRRRCAAALRSRRLERLPATRSRPARRREARGPGSSAGSGEVSSASSACASASSAYARS